MYLIAYSAEAITTGGGTTVSVRAVVNGTEIAGSQATVDTDTLSQVLPISKSFIASINASDILKLQFAGGNLDNRLFGGNGLGNTRPSVSLTITRIQ